MEEEISLIDIIRVLKKKAVFIIGVSVGASVVAAVILLLQPKAYHSYSIVRIGIIGNKPLETVPEIRQIMTSQYMEEKILKELNIPFNRKNLGKIRSVYNFKDLDALLTIEVRGATPEETLKYVTVGTDILIKRHEGIYQVAQKRLFESMSMIKNRIAPSPLSTSISDIITFNNAPTILEVPPQRIDYPVPTKKRLVVMVVFLMSFLGTSLTSILLEGFKSQR